MKTTYTNKQFINHLDKTKIKTILEIGSRDCMDSLDLQSHFDADIYSIDGNPDVKDICSKNARKNPRVNFYNYVVWKENKKIKFRPVDMDKSQDKNIGASSIFKWDLYKKFPSICSSEDIIQKEIEIDAITIDWFCKKYCIQPDYLCMDIQGSELQALIGSVKTLPKIRYILTEVEFTPSYNYPASYDEIISFLTQHDFVEVERENCCHYFGNILFYNEALI